MVPRILAAILATGLMFAPIVSAQKDKDKKKTAQNTAMSDDMQRAIAWEHFKDMAAARQARLEARHPSVTYSDSNRSADRSIEEPQGKPVKDPGPTVRKDK